MADLYNSTSLALFPLVGTASVLHLHKPINGRADFEVVRAGDTATRVNPSGLIETVPANVPRIDFTYDEAGELLIEPQRTNLITYSEQLDNAAWQKLNSTVSADATISPDGTTNADKLVEDTATAEHIIRSSAISITSGNDYALTIFAKQSERGIIRMGADDQANLPGRAFFDLSAGTVGTIAGGASASIEALSNGWYRCTLIATASGSVGGVNMEINLAIAGETVSYLGDGSSGAFLFGGQIEESPYATSYIPTVASAVTRNADVISRDGISEFLNSEQGTALVEFTPITNSLSGYFLGISDGTVNNRVVLGCNGTTYRHIVSTGGVTQADIQPTAPVLDSTGSTKVLITYNANDINVLTDGISVGTDSAATLPSSGTFDTFEFGNGGGSAFFYGRIKCVLYYQAELTTDEAEVLSSYSSFTEIANSKNYTTL